MSVSLKKVSRAPDRARACRAASRQRGLERASPQHTVAALQRMSVLFHRRWAMAILAELDRGDSHPGGAKFITLANRLNLSRDSLSATLAHLIKHDFVMRNPGYGHPMRPEYLLADAGYDAAPACTKLLAIIKSQQWEDIALRKWSLPVLFALANGFNRFGELKEALADVSPRALTLALKDLQTAGLIERRIADQYPPIAMYRAAPKARPLISLLSRL